VSHTGGVGTGPYMRASTAHARPTLAASAAGAVTASSGGSQPHKMRAQSSTKPRGKIHSTASGVFPRDDTRASTSMLALQQAVAQGAGAVGVETGRGKREAAVPNGGGSANLPYPCQAAPLRGAGTSDALPWRATSNGNDTAHSHPTPRPSSPAVHDPYHDPYHHRHTAPSPRASFISDTSTTKVAPLHLGQGELQAHKRMSPPPSSPSAARHAQARPPNSLLDKRRSSLNTPQGEGVRGFCMLTCMFTQTCTSIALPNDP